MKYKLIGLLGLLFLNQSCSANNSKMEDKDTQRFLQSMKNSESKYTILNKNSLIKVVSKSDEEITKIINEVTEIRKKI
ncbi:MAG: hypothetical protein K2X69_10070 [Silvanigrellaceae bacterium]|nr:hypothetical protein [Silvanigrellaceae bacterium]